jgi:uncharacterized protein (TIGR02145 family)
VLKSNSGWNAWLGVSVGTDNYNFSALSGGYRTDGSFDIAGCLGDWWSTSEYGSKQAYSRLIGFNGEYVSDNYSDGKSNGFSVWCVLDE